MNESLKRRIAPSVPLVLQLEDDDGGVSTRTLRLSFDFNAIALIEERTGIGVLDGEIWSVLDPRRKKTGATEKASFAAVASIMLWAAVIANHPEYGGDEGLICLRSYMSPQNTAEIVTAIGEAFAASGRKKSDQRDVGGEVPLSRKPENGATPSASVKSGRSRALTSVSAIPSSGA